jgi:hypothetical protein
MGCAERPGQRRRTDWRGTTRGSDRRRLGRYLRPRGDVGGPLRKSRAAPAARGRLGADRQRHRDVGSTSVARTRELYRGERRAAVRHEEPRPIPGARWDSGERGRARSDTHRLGETGAHRRRSRCQGSGRGLRGAGPRPWDVGGPEATRPAGGGGRRHRILRVAQQRLHDGRISMSTAAATFCRRPR